MGPVCFPSGVGSADQGQRPLSWRSSAHRRESCRGCQGPRKAKASAWGHCEDIASRSLRTTRGSTGGGRGRGPSPGHRRSRRAHAPAHVSPVASWVHLRFMIGVTKGPPVQPLCTSRPGTSIRPAIFWHMHASARHCRMLPHASPTPREVLEGGEGGAQPPCATPGAWWVDRTCRGPMSVARRSQRAHAWVRSLCIAQCRRAALFAVALPCDTA